MKELPEGVIVSGEPLSPEDIARWKDAPREHYDDFRVPNGHEYRLYGEDRKTPAIEELDANGKRLSWHPFSTHRQAEQVWVDLQASFNVRSRLADDPEWDGLFPQPSKPSIQ